MTCHFSGGVVVVVVVIETPPPLVRVFTSIVVTYYCHISIIHALFFLAPPDPNNLQP